MATLLPGLPKDLWAPILLYLSSFDVKKLLDTGSSRLSLTLRRTVEIVTISTNSDIVDVGKSIKWALSLSKLKSLSISGRSAGYSYARLPVDIADLVSAELTSLSLAFQCCPQFLLPSFDFSANLPSLTDLSLEGRSTSLELSDAKLPQTLRSLSLNTLHDAIIIAEGSIDALPASLTNLSLLGISRWAFVPTHSWPPSLRHLSLSGGNVDLMHLPHGLEALALGRVKVSDFLGLQKFPWRSWFPRLTDLRARYALMEDSLDTFTNPLALYQDDYFLPLLDFIRSDEKRLLSFLAARHPLDVTNPSSMDTITTIGHQDSLLPHQEDIYASYRHLKVGTYNFPSGPTPHLSSLITSEMEHIPTRLISSIGSALTLQAGSAALDSTIILPPSLTSLSCYTVDSSILLPSLHYLKCYRINNLPSPITSTNFVCQSLTSLICDIQITADWAKALPSTIETLTCRFELNDELNQSGDAILPSESDSATANLLDEINAMPRANSCDRALEILVSRLERLRSFKIRDSLGFPSRPLSPFASTQLERFTISRPKQLNSWLEALFGDDSSQSVHRNIFPSSLKFMKFKAPQNPVPLSVLAVVPRSLTELYIKCRSISYESLPNFPFSKLSPSDLMHRLPRNLITLSLAQLKRTGPPIEIEASSLAGWPRSLEKAFLCNINIILDWGKPLCDPSTELVFLEPHLPPNLLQLFCSSKSASGDLPSRKTLLNEDTIQ